MKKLSVKLQILVVTLFIALIAASYPYVKRTFTVFAQTTYSVTASYQGTGAVDQDDMAVWVHPTDPAQSKMIGSDKFGNIVFVYSMTGQQLFRYTDVGQPGNIDVRYNVRVNNQNIDIVAFNDRGGSIIRVYRINLDGSLTRIDNGGINTLSPNYGFGLYKSPTTGKLYGFVTTDGGTGIEQHEIFDAGNGQVDGTRVRNWTLSGSQSEGVVADDEKRLVYIGQERTGVWRVGAEPTDPTPGTQPATMKHGQSGINTGQDIEGLTLYNTGNGGGYLIVSNQGQSNFKVFDRNTYALVSTFKVASTSGTDGIQVINSNLGPSFPQGIFLAHSGGSAIRGVRWDTIAQGEGLTIDTSWNPRGGTVITGSPTNTPTRPPSVTATNTPTNRPSNTHTVTPSISVPAGKHLHLFVDGVDRGPHYSKSAIQVSNLPAGAHTLTLKLANEDHSFTGVEDTVNVTVSGSQTATISPTPTGGPISNALTDCSKYPERRIFLETQAWWMATDSIGTSEQLPVDGGIGGHTHTATCFPQDERISGGTLQFNVRLMNHKGNRGRVEWLDIGLGPDGQSIARVNLPNLTCAGATDPKVQCEWWIPISLDTSRVPAGYQELRFRFNVMQPNGERMFASTGWNAYFHGSTSTPFRDPPWSEARGWYVGVEYENARVRTVLPKSPVSGTFSFRAVMAPGTGGIPVRDRAVHVDARFNFDDFGTIYAAGNGNFDGTVSIDTTRLTNGPHCIALRTSAVDHNGGTNTGIFQFPIVVNNPGRPPGNGRGACYPGT